MCSRRSPLGHLSCVLQKALQRWFRYQDKEAKIAKVAICLTLGVDTVTNSYLFAEEVFVPVCSPCIFCFMSCNMTDESISELVFDAVGCYTARTRTVALNIPGYFCKATGASDIACCRVSLQLHTQQIRFRARRLRTSLRQGDLSCDFWVCCPTRI